MPIDSISPEASPVSAETTETEAPVSVDTETTKSQQQPQQQQPQQQHQKQQGEDGKGSKNEKPTDAEHRAQKRMEVMKEIVKTEKTFVDGLKFLDRYYISPIRTLSLPPANLMKQEHYKKCFTTIFVILNVNTMLLEKLEALERVDFDDSQTEDGNSIAQIFINMLPMLKCYTEYINNYDEISNLIKQLMKEDIKFDAFMKGIETKTKRDGYLGFFGYMITPVQRLPRYGLLLRELLKYTDQEDSEVDLLKQALQKCEQVANHVNENLRAWENQRKMLQITGSIGGLDHIAKYIANSPQQKFILEGEVRYAGASKFLILLSDVLLICRIGNRDKKKRLFKWIPFDERSIPWIVSQDDDGTEFDLVSDEGILTFKTATADQKLKWVHSIEETIENLIQTRPHMKELRKSVINKRKRKTIRQSQRLMSLFQNHTYQDFEYMDVVRATKEYISEGIKFKKSDILFVRSDEGDGTKLVIQADVSKRRIGDIPVPVEAEYFEALSEMDRVVCPYVKPDEKRKLIEQRNSLIMGLRSDTLTIPSSTDDSHSEMSLNSEVDEEDSDNDDDDSNDSDVEVVHQTDNGASPQKGSTSNTIEFSLSVPRLVVPPKQDKKKEEENNVVKEEGSNVKEDVNGEADDVQEKKKEEEKEEEEKEEKENMVEEEKKFVDVPSKNDTPVQDEEKVEKKEEEKTAAAREKKVKKTQTSRSGGKVGALLAKYQDKEKESQEAHSRKPEKRNVTFKTETPTTEEVVDDFKPSEALRAMEAEPTRKIPSIDLQEQRKRENEEQPQTPKSFQPSRMLSKSYKSAPPLLNGDKSEFLALVEARKRRQNKVDFSRLENRQVEKEMPPFMLEIQNKFKGKRFQKVAERMHDGLQIVKTADSSSQ